MPLPSNSHLSLWADSPFCGLVSPNPSLSILWNTPHLASLTVKFLSHGLRNNSRTEGLLTVPLFVSLPTLYCIWGSRTYGKLHGNAGVRFQARMESCSLCSWIAWTCSRASIFMTAFYFILNYLNMFFWTFPKDLLLSLICFAIKLFFKNNWKLLWSCSHLHESLMGLLVENSTVGTHKPKIGLLCDPETPLLGF